MEEQAEKTVAELAKVVYDTIAALDSWRGELSWNQEERLLEYRECAKAVGLTGQPLSEIFADPRTGILARRIERRGPLFQFPMPEEKFQAVGEEVRRLTLLNKQLGAVPTIGHPFRVRQDRGTQGPQDFEFEDMDEFDKNLTKDPFGRWVWRRTGILLSCTDSPAIHDLVSGEEIYVKYGWETRRLTLEYQPAVYLERIQKEQKTEVVKLNWIEVPSDDQAPPVFVPMSVQTGVSGATSGSNETTFGVKGTGVSNLFSIDSTSPTIDRDLFVIKDGPTTVLSISNDGTMTFNGKKAPQVVDEPKTEIVDKPEESSGWGAPLACLAAVGLLGVLASKSKSVSKSQPKTQPAVQEA